MVNGKFAVNGQCVYGVVGDTSVVVGVELGAVVGAV
jgi:hypothetical protein